jgi:1-acyl-sn-glycerol-3-phosphate acyltransferase
MKIFAKFVAFLLKVRYKVDLKNLESIDEKSNYLVLPNHVAWVDPVIIRSHLRPYIKIRPVVTSDFSKNPALSRIFKLMQTVTIEEMDDKA